MLTCILALVLASQTLPAGQPSHRIEWASSAFRDTKDMRLTLGVVTHGERTELTLTAEQAYPKGWAPVARLTRTWDYEQNTGVFWRADPIQVAGCQGPQILVMYGPGNSSVYEVYTVDDRWSVGATINRTFHYNTQDDASIKWKTKSGELVEIELFAEKAMPEEEWLSHPKKDGKTWVAHRVYRWDQDDFAWKLVKDEHKYYDLDNETIKDSLSYDTELWFAFARR